MDQFSRTRLLIGEEGINKLKRAKVAIFGVGGVGSYTAEGLARAGVGHFVLVDKDDICVTNLNRQIHALHSTIGKPKVEVMKERISEINPEAEVEALQAFYLPENAEQFLQEKYDYIVDAVDNVTAKIDLAVRAEQAGIPLISAMGAANKLNPFLFEVADIYKTSVCPLAKVVRRELRNRGVKSLKVVYSKEDPIKPKETEEGQRVVGSISFVPSVMGLMIASEVVKDLLY
ncbi:MAG: tRNA threonylcarbamoyladenosine dehydratase [Clostridia bacterium]|nr:tRNA threonylcarbamoyladenosine dehydratase [Clostridia bacterium]